LTFGTAAFGPQSFDLTGTLQLVDDGVAPTTDACTAPINGAALAGKIALIDRGSCSFVSKARWPRTPVPAPCRDRQQRGRLAHQHGQRRRHGGEHPGHDDQPGRRQRRRPRPAR
jgi:hypothetical protein